LATVGIPSANLAGIGITITLPSGVTPSLNSDGTVAASVVSLSGVAVSGLATSSYDTSTRALIIVLASSVNLGFGAGEFATVVLSAAAGSNPAQSDFTLSGFVPDAVVTHAPATGVTSAISGFTVL
jgi:hypothetical protein